MSMAVSTDCSERRAVTEPLLEIEGLTKRFGGVLASDAISLSLPPGELHAVIGPNGAGKTTMIGQLTGEIRPDIVSVTAASGIITATLIFRRRIIGLPHSSAL